MSLLFLPPISQECWVTDVCIWLPYIGSRHLTSDVYIWLLYMGSRHLTSVVRLERQAPLLPEPSCWPSRREKSLVETHEVGGYSKMGEVCRSQVLRHSYHLSWWKLGVLHCTRVYLTVIRTLAHTRAHTNTLVGFKWLFGELRYLKIVGLLPVTFHLFTIMGILINQPGRVFKTFSILYLAFPHRRLQFSY